MVIEEAKKNMDRFVLLALYRLALYERVDSDVRIGSFSGMPGFGSL